MHLLHLSAVLQGIPEAPISLEELLAYRLNTLHNLHYYLSLMKSMREAIEAGTFLQWRRDFYAGREAPES